MSIPSAATRSARDTAPPARASPFEHRHIRAGLRTDYDLARVYRLVSVATLLSGAAAVLGARSQRSLTVAQRRLSAAVGAAYASVGAFGLWGSPPHIALWFQRRPRRTLLASAVPLALVGASGGARTPLYRLASLGVATAAGARGRRSDAQLQSLLAGLVWCASAYLSEGAPRGRARVYLDIPLGFLVSARLAATATQVAYDSRNLFDQLFEFAYEREDLQPYVDRLTDALQQMRELLLEAAAAAPAKDGLEGALLDHTIASLGRLDERLGVLSVAALSTFDLDGLVSDASAGWRASLPHLEPAIVTRGSRLKRMLEDRAGAYGGLCPGLPVANVTVAPDVQVRGLQRLALIGASVTAASSNIVRHASNPTSIDVDLDRRGAMLVLRVTNDGGPATSPVLDPRQPSGLTHLQEQIERFGGSLTVGPLPSGDFELCAVIPAESEPHELEFWAQEIRREITESLAQTTTLAAAKSIAAMILPRRLDRSRMPTRSWRSWRAQVDPATAAHAALVLASQWHTHRGRLRDNGGHEQQLHLLLASAAMNYMAVRQGKAPSRSWVNAFGSCHAFDSNSPEHSSRRAYALVGLNAAAIAVGSRGRARGHLWSLAGEIFSTTFGPLLIAGTINPAQPRIRTLESAINERLSEVEALHALANSFHSDHPAPPKIEDLTPMIGDPSLRVRLQDGLDAVSDAEEALLAPEPRIRHAIAYRHLLGSVGELVAAHLPAVSSSSIGKSIWPQPESYYSPTVGVPDAVRLGDYLAYALGRRIWPATVCVEFDRESVKYLPDTATTGAAFRREAVAAMDVVGRELNHELGRRWDGLWLLQRVDLKISVNEHTGSILCRMVPWAPRPSRSRRAIDSLHERLSGLPLVDTRKDRREGIQRLLSSVGAVLAGWALDSKPAEDLPEIIVPSQYRPVRVVPRGEVAVTLYPGRYTVEA